MSSEITFFAKTNFRNQERAFGIKADDRRRHMYVIGKTGMGKTNLLENLAIQDIRNGHGCCFIDPHGDTAERLLKAVPNERINDVIYFNPADQIFPIAFNVIEVTDPEYKHLVASGLVAVFKKIWADSWGPRLEYILRNAILALLDYPGSTLLGVTRMLVDKRYREKVVEKTTDPVVKMFWTDEFTKWNDKTLAEVISPIQNKVGQFLANSLIRNIVGQTQSSFDVRKVMDEQKILILNLAKGRIGEDASALLGAMMITKIQLAAMGRVDIEEDARKDFYLYVDEFQNFSTESFANILSEARKYRLNLILANQYVEQIIETVRNAIFGNVGTIVSFRVGATDAEFLEKEFSPIFLQNDIVNLPKYNIYLKLMIDGIAGDAFSATVLPPVFLGDTEMNAEKIIQASRERYASSKEEVEEKIAKWSGMIPVEHFKPSAASIQMVQNMQQSATRIPPVSIDRGTATQPAVHNTGATSDAKSPVVIANDVQTQQPPKPMFDALCDMCGDSIKVPFQPDGKRPTFCKDCLKDYQRMSAKAKVAEEKKKQYEQEDAQISASSEENSAMAQKSPSTNGYTKNNKFQKPERVPRPAKTIEHKLISPHERPMTLSQIQSIAPKKFKPARTRPSVNLDDVRNLIQKQKEN